MLTTVATNPFVLMMDPQAVIDAMEASAPLGGLHSRVYRPLDKPLIPKKLSADLLAYDQDIDADLDDDA